MFFITRLIFQVCLVTYLKIFKISKCKENEHGANNLNEHILLGSNEWLLTPHATNANNAWNLNSTGSLSFNNTANGNAVRPAD